MSKLSEHEQLLGKIAAAADKQLLTWVTVGVQCVDKSGNPTGEIRDPNAKEMNAINARLKQCRIEVPFSEGSDLGKTAAQLALENSDVNKAKGTKQVSDIIAQIGVSKQG